MKRVLLCLGCGLLSLALALGLAACGGGQTAVPTASPSQQQETPRTRGNAGARRL